MLQKPEQTKTQHSPPSHTQQLLFPICYYPCRKGFNVFTFLNHKTAWEGNNLPREGQGQAGNDEAGHSIYILITFYPKGFCSDLIFPLLTPASGVLGLCSKEAGNNYLYPRREERTKFKPQNEI